jgi:3-phenylpropionate/trans-cinnamate dioxygenase ferredoxin subunit
MAWQLAARVADIEEGGVLGVTLGEHEIALYRIAGRIYATANICTHEFALLSEGEIVDDCVECPMHQARFHIPTGAVRCEPATEPIATYPVKIVADDVFVAVPDA